MFGVTSFLVFFFKKKLSTSHTFYAKQIRDLKIYIEAQKKLSSITDSDGIKGGTLLPVPEMQSSPTPNKRRTKLGRRRS